ncbi:MAG: hypothetical protein WCD89_06400 [Anaerocolumna sp.]
MDSVNHFIKYCYYDVKYNSSKWVSQEDLYNELRRYFIGKSKGEKV